MSKGLTLTLGMALFIALGPFFILLDRSPIKFESWESKTIHQGPVFNRIKLLVKGDQDIWLMQQTHSPNGGLTPHESWDRLSIVVDKSQSPFRVSYYQFIPGPLAMGGKSEWVKIRANCLSCHSNGPRVIRPMEGSHSLEIGPYNKLKIAVWNWKIKTYGKVTGNTINGEIPQRHKALSRPLQLNSCMKCHSSSGIRNELKLENLHTAKFLVENKIMPPFPLVISPEDLSKLKKIDESN